MGFQFWANDQQIQVLLGFCFSFLSYPIYSSLNPSEILDGFRLLYLKKLMINDL